MVLEYIGVERELLHPASFSRSISTAKLKPDRALLQSTRRIPMVEGEPVSTKLQMR